MRFFPGRTGLEEKDNPNERLLDHMVLQEVMATLEEREKRLIEMRYFEEKTQNQVAAGPLDDPGQVSRMEKKILKKCGEGFYDSPYNFLLRTAQ